MFYKGIKANELEETNWVWCGLMRLSTPQNVHFGDKKHWVMIFEEGSKWVVMILAWGVRDFFIFWVNIVFDVSAIVDYDGTFFVVPSFSYISWTLHGKVFNIPDTRRKVSSSHIHMNDRSDHGFNY